MMEQHLPDSLPYTVVPNGGRLAVRLLDFVLNDVLVIVPSFMVLFVGAQLYGLRLGVLLSVVFCLLLYRFPYGRGYSTLADLFRTWFIRYIKKGVLQDPDAEGWLRRRLYQRPLSHLSVQRIDAGNQSVSVLHDEKRKLDKLFIVGRGSNASSLDMAAYAEFNNRIAQLVKHVKAETPLQIGTSYGRLLRPEDPFGFALSMFQIMDPDVAVPEGLVTPHVQLTRRQRVEMRLYGIANELKTEMCARGADPTYFTAITVRRPSAWLKFRKRELSDRDLYNAPVMRMAKTIREDLEELGVEEPRWLSLTEMAYLYRCSWDVGGLEGYRALRARGQVPSTDDQLELSEDGEVLTALMHMPAGKVTVGRNWICIGTTYHRVLRVTSFPRQVLSNVIHKLYSQTGFWSGVAFTGETISGRSEDRRFQYGITFMRGLDKARGQKVYVSPDEKQKQRDLEQRHAEIQRSGTVGQPGNVFITVSGTSLEELDDAQHAFEKHARLNGMKVKVVKGECRQFPAMQAGTLGVSM